jgi:hypothetical protein
MTVQAVNISAKLDVWTVGALNVTDAVVAAGPARSFVPSPFARAGLVYP